MLIRINNLPQAQSTSCACSFSLFVIPNTIRVSSLLNCAASARLYTLHFTHCLFLCLLSRIYSGNPRLYTLHSKPQLFCYPSPLFLFSSRHTCRVKLCHLFCFCQCHWQISLSLHSTLVQFLRFFSFVLSLSFPC